MCLTFTNADSSVTVYRGQSLENSMQTGVYCGQEGTAADWLSSQLWGHQVLTHMTADLVWLRKKSWAELKMFWASGYQKEERFPTECLGLTRSGVVLWKAVAILSPAAPGAPLCMSGFPVSLYPWPCFERHNDVIDLLLRVTASDVEGIYLNDDDKDIFKTSGVECMLQPALKQHTAHVEQYNITVSCLQGSICWMASTPCLCFV